MTSVPAGYSASYRSGSKAMLESFPPELLENILLNLSEKGIASSRGVSRIFRDVVRGSLRLQYRIECFRARVVDNPFRKDVGLQERLDKVKIWRDASQAYRWTGETQVTVTHPLDEYDEDGDGDDFVGHRYGAFCRAFGPAYVLQEHRCITTTQPPSNYKGRPEKKWVIHDAGFLPRDFAYDAYEEILILVERIDEQNYRVHLMAPSGAPHPSVTIPTLPISVPEWEIDLFGMDPECRVLLYSDLLLVSVDRKAEFGDSEVWVFNWQTGALLLNVWGYANDSTEPRGVAFLDHGHILLPLIDTSKVNGLVVGAGVAVLDIFPSNPLRRSTVEVARDAKVLLSLPKPLKKAQYDRVLAFGHPLPSPDHASSLEEIFFQRQDTSLVGISFGINAISERKITNRTFNLLVSREFIRTLLVAPPSHSSIRMVTVPWDDWAPHTRMFLFEPVDDYQLESPSILASRCFIMPDRTYYDLDINAFDFIPKENHLVYENATTQPTTILEPEMWAGPLHIGSELSFRRSVIQSIPSLEFPDDNFVVGEDFIVVLRPSDDETIVYTYWI